MAFPGDLTYYCSNTKWTAVTTWATGQAKNVGDLVKQTGTPTVGNERVWVCTVAGTTGGGADPLTTFTRGVIIGDNGISWQECTGHAAVNGDMTNTPTWTVGAKNQAITLGHIIKSDDGTKILICTVAGTAGNGAEPTWGTTLGVDIADGATLKWKLLKTGSAVFANWAAPFPRMGNALLSTWGSQDNTTLYVGHDHAETHTTNITFASHGSQAGPDQIISVNTAGAVPPVDATLLAGGSIACTGTTTITLVGAYKWIYGITFTAGTSGTCDINIGNDTLDKYFENCHFNCGPGTGSASSPLKGVEDGGRNRFKDCTVKFTNAGQGMDIGAAFWEFENLTLDPTGTKPTSLIGNGAGTANNALVTFRGCDFSFFTSGTFIVFDQRRAHNYVFEDCNFPTGITFCSTANLTVSDEYATFIRCMKGIPGDYDFQRYGRQGSQTVDIVVTRNGGAQSAQGQSFSWKLTGSAVCNNGVLVLDSSRLGYYSDAGNGSSDTPLLTIYGIANMATMPTDVQSWFQAQYLGNASNSQGILKSSRGNLIGTGTALAADTSDWDDNVIARANTTAYSVGDTIKLASNPGRVFFCTTAGTTAGSEPGGYASAVDGGSVTDNTAVFRAGWRFVMTKQLTSPSLQQDGYVYATIRMGVASTTIYYDPKIGVS